MILKNFCENANWLAIIVATLAYFFLGAIWYTKILFAKPWMAGHGIKEPTAEEKKAMGGKLAGMMIGSILISFISACVIALLAYALQSTTAMSGIKLGLACGVFAAGPICMSYIYLQKPFKLWLIDSGYHVVSYIIVAVIISVWH
ncbi:MAG: DUF1761 domain-containing protein [Bacteroidia bacterium]